jgi:hypothetical protein
MKGYGSVPKKGPARVLKFPRVPIPPPTKVRLDKRKKDPKHKEKSDHVLDV